MNTIVLNRLSNNYLVADRESFQEELKKCLFYGIINKGEVDENINISSIFGMFFDENITLVEFETYKISLTIKNERIFGNVIQHLFRKALSKEPLKNEVIDLTLKGILSNDKIWSGYYNHNDMMNLEYIQNNHKIKILTPIFSNNKSISILSKFASNF